MKHTLPLLTALLLAPLAALAGLRAADESKSAPDLKPGARLILKFPELPQTLYAMQSGEEGTPQLYIALPENYSANRKFPLFVFLYGGHGGPGAGPGRGKEIMENRDCIFVNLPLFKKKLDPDGPFKGLLVSPEQNGFVESFHGRFRDECLNREQLWTLTEARVVIEDFRYRYNHFRPHRKLGYQSPVRFAQQLTPSSAPVGLRPPCAGDGQNHHDNLNQQTNPSD